MLENSLLIDIQMKKKLIRQSLLLPSLDPYQKLSFVLDQALLLLNPFGLTYQIGIFLIVLVGYVEIFFIIIVDL